MLRRIKFLQNGSDIGYSKSYPFVFGFMNGIKSFKKFDGDQRRDPLIRGLIKNHPSG
jgi:hypothetical protein